MDLQQHHIRIRRKKKNRKAPFLLQSTCATRHCREIHCCRQYNVVVHATLLLLSMSLHTEKNVRTSKTRLGTHHSGLRGGSSGYFQIRVSHSKKASFVALVFFIIFYQRDAMQVAIAVHFLFQSIFAATYLSSSYNYVCAKRRCALINEPIPSECCKNDN